MKMLLSIFVLFAGLTAQAQILSLCQPDHENYQEFCSRMKHLRATINVLDQQREMTLVNYSYMAQMGSSLQANAEKILSIAPAELKDHVPALNNLIQIGSEIQKQASARDSKVFILTNKTQTQCLSCHDSSGPVSSSSGWNEVFKMNWSKVSQECSVSGRNPYLCKSMNGMLTSYNHMLTAYLANIENYDVTQGVAQEVLRILRDLRTNNFLHFAEEFSTKTEASAEEIMNLAKAKDPATFGKALQLTKSCNQCHTDAPSNN